MCREVPFSLCEEDPCLFLCQKEALSYYYIADHSVPGEYKFSPQPVRGPSTVHMQTDVLVHA